MKNDISISKKANATAKASNLTSFNNEKDLEKLISKFESSVKTGKGNVKDKLVSDSTCKSLYILLRVGKKVISKSYIFRYSFNGKLCNMVIGYYHSMELTKARNIAKEYNITLTSKEYKDSNINLKKYMALLDNKDNASKLTFSEVFNEWIEKKNIRESTKKQYKVYLKTFIARFGNRLIGSITKIELMEYFNELQVSNKIAKCKNLYMIAKAIFNYCVARDYILHSEFSRMAYNVLFQQYKAKHHKAHNEKELSTLLNGLKACKSVSFKTTLDFNIHNLIYKFCIYTPLRINNILSLEWSHVDLEKAMLVIPNNKMKSNREFKLPLNKQSLEILNFMHSLKVDKFVFSKALNDTCRNIRVYLKAIDRFNELKDSGNEINIRQFAKNNNLIPQNLSNVYLNINSYKAYIKKKLNKAINYSTLYISFITRNKLPTPHTMRSTFSTLLYDLTPIHKLDFTIIEMCLAHTIGNQVIRSYNHSERMVERRELMEFWGNYVDSLISDNTKLKKASGNDDLFILHPNKDDNLLF